MHAKRRSRWQSTFLSVTSRLVNFDRFSMLLKYLFPSIYCLVILRRRFKKQASSYGDAWPRDDLRGWKKPPCRHRSGVLLAGRRGSQSPQPRALGESRTECCGDATLLNATLLTRYLSPLQSIIRTIVAWRPRALLPTPDSRPGKLHDSTKCRSRKQERYCDRSCPSVHFSPPALRVAQARRAYVLLMFFFHFLWFLSAQLSEHLLDRSSPNLQGWQNSGCGWTSWSSLFDSSRDFAAATNFVPLVWIVHMKLAKAAAPAYDQGA